MILPNSGVAKKNWWLLLKENALAEVKLKQQLQADDEVNIDI